MNQNSNKYSLVIFDLDGTVADTDEMLIQSMNYLYDRYRGGKRTPKEQIYFFSGPPISETLRKEFPDLDYEFILGEYRKISSSLYESTVTPFPYCLEVIKELKDKGVRLFVNTNKNHKLSIVALNIVGLLPLVEGIVAMDDVTNIKPASDGVEKILEISGITDRSKVLYVGDNDIDIQTANNAGIDSALCYWGPRKDSVKLQPKYKLNSYLDLRRIFEND